VVSARQKEQEKVAALDAGANDYITKPFGNQELLARIRTALRQYERMQNSRIQMEQEFSAGDLRINFARREVRVGDRQVHLTPIEYRIVVLLARNAGMVLTHEHILKEIWGPFSSDSQLLRVNMANIRRKIEPNPADPRYILTEVGVGYRMIDSEPTGGN
jgi:two-component system KDP operon response regulator KdpE